MARAIPPTAREIVPEDPLLRRFLRRNLKSLIGLGLIAVVGAGIVALATWHVDDPSFSNANGQAAQNMLGYPGAVIADLVMQFLGIAAPLLLIPGLLWGWRLLTGAELRFKRFTPLTYLGGVILGAGAVATLPVPASWPLPSGLGGATGDLLLDLPIGIFGGVTGAVAVLTGVVFTLASAFLLLHATGFYGRRQPHAPAVGRGRRATPEPKRAARGRRAPEPEPVFDDEESDGKSRFFALAAGAVAHAGYSVVASAGRLIARWRRPKTDEFGYVEPVLSRSASRRQPHLTARELPADDQPLERAADDEFDDYGVPAFDPADDAFGAAAPVRPATRGASGARPTVAAPLPAGAPPGTAPRRRVAAKQKGAGGHYELPPLELLAPPKQAKHAHITKEALEENARLLESVLDDFGVRGEIVNVRPGPVVTLYELEPAPGIKSSRVIGLADDIARSMSAIACRVAVIPGKNAIGIELPNEFRETVFLREQLSSKDFIDTKARLPLCLGKTIGGEPVVADLSRMPHLLVAGTTGSGKSVAINTMILSLLYRLTPEACRLILIDPKMLELSVYDGIPHLLTPVVTDPKKAVVALKWTVREMEDRYRKMSKLGVRNIDGLNARITQAMAKGETITRTVHTGFDPETGEPIHETEELDLKPMPHIVVIIDEMADLMMVAGKDIEGAVQRLAQMARAAGIHVAMATQRPSVDVITGTIKANFPTRISFQVTSKIDSRTILGEQGAEQLLGQGDMLYMVGGGRIQRVHGPFVSDTEVEKVVAHLKAQGSPDYLEAITADEDDEDGMADGGGASFGDESGDLYDQAVAVVLRDRKVSTSYVQRRLGIGYNRAASLIERMEKEGVIGAANHAGKREILVPAQEERF
ncbi:MAG: DNA translocase FtsK [Bauldia sp.]